MDMSQINLDGLVHDAIEQSQPIAKRRGIEVSARIDSNSIIMANSAMLTWAFLDLIGNAIKHGKKGGNIVVSTRSSASLHKVAVVVGDDGEGIEQDEIDTVSDLLSRTEEVRIGAEKGRRLGLAVTKEIVEQHKGRISIRSKRGVGTIVAMEFETI